MTSRGDQVAQLMDAMEDFAQWHQAMLREHVIPGITLRSAALIHAAVQQPGLSAGDVAKRLRVSPALVTKILGQATAAGYIGVEKDPQDGRFRRIYATHAGRAVYDQMIQAVAGRTQAMFADWSEGELRLFATLLERRASTQTPGKTAPMLASTPLLTH